MTSASKRLPAEDWRRELGVPLGRARFERQLNSSTMMQDSSTPPASGDEQMTRPLNEEVPQSALDHYGIQRVPADAFLWGGYRYSNARDALAAAKRNAK